MSVENLSRIPQFLMFIKESILERNPLDVMNVGKPIISNTRLVVHIRTHGGGDHMNVINVGKLPAV